MSSPVDYQRSNRRLYRLQRLAACRYILRTQLFKGRICPALEEASSKKVIDTIKGGSPLYIWTDDRTK